MGTDHKHRLYTFEEAESWICFCCGCGFFRDENGQKVKDTCEKALFIEKTDLDKCTLCGVCIDVCSFDARSINDEDSSTVKTATAALHVSTPVPRTQSR